MSSNYRTPEFVAAYAYVNKPDEAFGGKKYRLSAALDKDTVTRILKGISTDVLEQINKAIAENPKKEKQLKELAKSEGFGLLKQVTDENNPSFGKYQLNFKTTFKPTLLDAEGNVQDDIEVYSGDIVRAVFEPRVYCSSMIGVTFYLKSVQLIEKGDGKSYATIDLGDSEASNGDGGTGEINL